MIWHFLFSFSVLGGQTLAMKNYWFFLVPYGLKKTLWNCGKWCVTMQQYFEEDDCLNHQSFSHFSIEMLEVT